MTSIVVPDIRPDEDTLTAALQYAAAGIYVLPVLMSTKHPGSVARNKWQTKSSRDPAQIAAWFAGTNYGLAWHMGRSGLIGFDADSPDKLPAVLLDAIAATAPPYQSTRENVPGRGHYVFAMPAGRMLGNGVGRLGGSWGEIRGKNGILVVAPSAHENAADGGRYAWQSLGPVPVLPESVAELLDDSGVEVDAATDEQIEVFLTAHTDSTRPELLDVWGRLFGTKVAEGESRHQRMISVLAGAMKESRASFLDARKAAETLQAAFLAAVAKAPVGKQGEARTGSKALGEWTGILAWAVAQAEVADLDEVRRRTSEKVPDVSEWLLAIGASPETVTLEGVITATRQLHHVVDAGPIRFALAVAVSSVLEEEPLWGMHVGAPSSGKTVIQELLSGVADDQVDELTVAGLPTWSKGGKRGAPAKQVGLLPRIGTRGFATIGDFSTILAGSDHNGRDQLFGDPRRVYDGKFSRNMDSPDGQPLRWAGRLTLHAAVTPEIDRYSNHGDALGPRWLYIRTEAASTADKKAAARKARRRHSAGEHRKLIRAAASALVDRARKDVGAVDLSDDAHDQLDDAALVACWGRASVPRQKFGRREVDGVAVIEEPPRLVRQLVTLTRCLVALGDTEQDAVDLARRCALDTVPAARRDCLAYLSNGEELTVSDIARKTRHHRDVIRRSLEDMQIVGLTTCPIREDAEVDQDDPLSRTKPAPWTLHGDDGRLAMLVLTDPHARSKTRSRRLRDLATRSRYPTPIPPK